MLAEKISNGIRVEGKIEGVSVEEEKEVASFRINPRPFKNRIEEACVPVKNEPDSDLICAALYFFLANFDNGGAVHVPFKGALVEEWPEEEKEIWKFIQELAKISGSYGNQKEAIQNFEAQLQAFQEKRDLSVYAPFLFNPNSEEQDASLRPFILRSTQHCADFLCQSYANDWDSEPSKERKTIEKLYFWENIVNILYNGLHQAQQRGWNNWTRLSFSAGMSKCIKRIKQIEIALDAIKEDQQKKAPAD